MAQLCSLADRCRCYCEQLKLSSSLLHIVHNKHNQLPFLISHIIFNVAVSFEALSLSGEFRIIWKWKSRLWWRYFLSWYLEVIYHWFYYYCSFLLIFGFFYIYGFPKHIILLGYTLIPFFLSRKSFCLNFLNHLCHYTPTPTAPSCFILIVFLKSCYFLFDF